MGPIPAPLDTPPHSPVPQWRTFVADTPDMPRQYHVYILVDQGRCLAVGVTAQLYRRWLQLRTASACDTCKRHHIARLVYAEPAASAKSAAARAAEIVKWDRRRKERLIKSLNPDRRDLAVVWGWRARAVTKLVLGVEAEVELA